MIMKVEDINIGVDEHWDQAMGALAEAKINDNKAKDDTNIFIDIGGIVINDAANRNRILDNESVATMKSSAEAGMRSPEGLLLDKDIDGEIPQERGSKVHTHAQYTLFNYSVIRH
jgi:hypothetical protein